MTTEREIAFRDYVLPILEHTKKDLKLRIKRSNSQNIKQLVEILHAEALKVSAGLFVYNTDSAPLKYFKKNPELSNLILELAIYFLPLRAMILRGELPKSIPPHDKHRVLDQRAEYVKLDVALRRCLRFVDSKEDIVFDYIGNSSVYQPIQKELEIAVIKVVDRVEKLDSLHLNPRIALTSVTAYEVFIRAIEKIFVSSGIINPQARIINTAAICISVIGKNEDNDFREEFEKNKNLMDARYKSSRSFETSIK